jgi:aminotransferase EvaB
MIRTLDLERQHSQMRGEIVAALSRVVDSGRFILGEEVSSFEEEFAAVHGARYGVGVNSGTDALRIALRALNVQAGDEVITTANTFVATVGAIVELGATPVLVDVGHDENIDPQCVSEAITPRTKAVIVVHLRGNPADVSSIRGLCEPAGITVIEDCSQAAGASTATGPVGSQGTIGCFSLHPQKNLGGIGDAGIIVTDRADVAESCRLLRNHGLRTRDDVEVFGYNSRLDPLQAAVLRIKLGRLASWNRRRRSIAEYYSAAWRELPIELPGERPGDVAVYYHYVVRTADRDRLRARLASSGIEALVHYPVPIHQQPAFKSSMPAVRLKVTEHQASRILSIPSHNWLTDAEVETVAEAVVDFFRDSPGPIGLDLDKN